VEVIGYDVPMQKRRMVIEVIDDQQAVVLRRKSGAQRLQIVDSLFRTARRLIESNIRATHIDWDEARIHDEIARRIAGGSN
jgi:hypothetical protein